MNWNLIFVRAYWRGLAVFGTAIVVAIPLTKLQGSTLHQVAAAGPWIVSTGAVAAIGLFAAATLRLRAWEADRMHACRHCSGPLGHVRGGIRGRSDFRRCLQCDRCTPEP